MREMSGMLNLGVKLPDPISIAWNSASRRGFYTRWVGANV